ncbi:MAG: asparagine synthase (glutamine-hydrolyzing) [Ruminococcaceae bacterium]|nr:asparagine synthase (glutamine-hydrolyzing) [Oscillospiraceae bacterium]
MCGFVGFSGKLERKQEILNKMMARIIHRGPDSAGEYLDEDAALGFRRLSIIDLANGSQPMYNEDGSIVIVFNGEIYNFMELCRELQHDGHVFATNSDTEVLVHGWEKYGEELASHLRGMFAFVIYDKNQKRFYGARDIFGIKPFYYYKTAGGDYLFGSEIKSFLEHPNFDKKLNRRALRPYLTFQYSSLDETFFEGVFKLPPAHSFTLELGGEMKIARYWDADFTELPGEFEAYVDAIDKTVHESVEAHRISDVKVGAFLSGGVDSSYITACLMPDKTFSVGFAYDKFNETDYAKELSDKLGIENYRKLITADECFDAFSDIQYHMDEPQSNPSSVPLYFLAKLAREHVTVVLSGEGADEIYAGYEWYDESPLMQKYKRIPKFLRVAAAGIAKKLPYFKGHDFIIKSSGNPEDYFIGQARVWPEKEALAVLKPEYRVGPSVKEVTAPIYARVKDKSELDKKQYLDLNLWMPGDILLKADKMSMAHSLELRVPFLDKKVMEQAQAIPHEYKINGKNTKYIFRKAANRTLPDEWADRKKMGFPVPIRYWMQEEKYYNLIKAEFESDAAKEFFDTDALISLLDAHHDGKANNGRKIWTVYTFLIWYRRFFLAE